MPRNEMAQLARNVISKASENLGHLEFAKFISLKDKHGAAMKIWEDED